MSIVFDQVSFRYGASGRGLQTLSLAMQPGELLAVIGPSGSGKSTLLRLVAGLLNGYTGRIALNGADLLGVPVHQRGIGMVFQSYSLFPHLDVLGNVAYALKMRGVAVASRERQAREMLEVVGLGDLAARPVDRLSGGQQQRVALARALVFGPQALLLDEPLAALDASIRGYLRDEIRAVQRRFAATTLLVTHDQEEALTMADRIAMLDDGKLVQLDTPRGLYERPVNKLVAKFVGLSSIFEGSVAALNLIDTGFARLHANTGTRVTGTAVSVLIRPEHVVADPPLDALNRLTGRAGTARYLGALTRYDFIPAGSTQPILGESANPPREAVAVHPDHIQLLDA